MVVMAESVQDQGLSAGMSEFSKEHGDAVGSRRVEKAKPDAVTKLRGVRRKPSGRYDAQIWVPPLRCNVRLGTFDTAEEAAKAYDAAAVELRACNQVKKKKAAAVELHACTPVKKKKAAAAVELDACTLGWAAKKKRAAARPDAWTKFRGVYRTISGKYVAQIKHSQRRSWLGTFDAAEDAARAYDAAAVKLHGTRAATNFKQPSEDKDTTAEKMAVKEEKMDLFNDFPEMPALDFLPHSFIPGARLDDLWAGLPPAERQLVDEFVKDTDLSDVAP